VIALTRQNLPQMRRERSDVNRCAAGGYEIVPAQHGKPAVSLFASGSEVSIAAQARQILGDRGVTARLVSVPCFELLRAAPAEARRAVIGDAPIRIGVEAAVRQGWDEIIGSDGIFIGMSGFGASAPYCELYRHFGITAQAIADAALRRLGAS